MHIKHDSSMMHINTLEPFLRPYAVAMVNGLRENGIPAMIISGRRNAHLNREVGGAETSLHLRGLAFDVQIEGFQRAELHPYFWQSIGEWWESLGGRWGGRFTPKDVNHFDTGVVSLVP